MIRPNSTVAKPVESSGILFSVRASDLPELPALARKFYDLGFTLYATTGNADTIERSGMTVTHVAKVHENYNDNVMTLLESGKIAYVVSTSAKGRDPVAESVKLRRLAVERDIDCLTAIDTANALADSLASPFSLTNASLVDINHM
jgi:carbamoyl-phosphate synthase large subunit